MTYPRLRMTRPTLKVLRAFRHAREGEELWGLIICERTGLGTGSVYPILERLLRRHWISDRWETDAFGRPPRRLYELTAHGRAEIAEAMASRRRVRDALDGPPPEVSKKSASDR